MKDKQCRVNFMGGLAAVDIREAYAYTNVDGWHTFTIETEKVRDSTR
jgi:hypothetical protein